MNFGSFSNALWNVIVTMTTVGYGDFFPQTHVGRTVGIFVCLWGVLVVSLFVVTLTNKLALSAQQEKTFFMLHRMQAKELMKVCAANVLGASYRSRQRRRERKRGGSDSMKEELRSLRKFRSSIIAF